MMIPRILTALLIVIVYTLQAVAADIEVRGSVQSHGRYNSEEHAVVIDSRVDFEVDAGPLTFGGAYRAYDFGETGYNPRGIDPTYHMKHRYVEGTVGNLFFRGGHFFSTFGRGLSLRSFESIDLEHDTALDGFIGEYKAGTVALAGFGGEVTDRPSNVQQITHRLRGGRMQLRSGNVSIALSGVDRNARREDAQVILPEDLALFDDYVVGTEAELWLGPVSVAGEYAGRRGDYYPELRQGDVHGHGAYLSGTAATTWSTWLVEYKEYERFEHALINPPTCIKDHIWILMNRVTHQVDLGDERGFLVEGTLMPVEAFQISGGASEARTQDGDLVHWEIFGQIDRSVPLWGITSVAGSWSREYASGRFTEYVTGVIDLNYDGGPLRGLEVDFEVQHTEEPSGTGFETYLASATCYPGQGLTVSLVGEATTENNPDRDYWISGDIRASVSDGMEVSVGGGSERGGRKCSGGICFVEPEFTGIRLRLLAYF